MVGDWLAGVANDVVCVQEEACVRDAACARLYGMGLHFFIVDLRRVLFLHRRYLGQNHISNRDFGTILRRGWGFYTMCGTTWCNWPRARRPRRGRNWQRWPAGSPPPARAPAPAQVVRLHGEATLIIALAPYYRTVRAKWACKW